MSKSMRSQTQADHGVDLGTSPHGLPADCSQTDSRPQAVQMQASPAPLHADPQAKRAGKPLVYRDAVVRGCCRALKAETLRQQSSGHFYLALDECEFLHLWFALSNVRSKLRTAISRGRADIGDLRATDSAWQKLAEIMNRRQYGGRA